MPPAGFRMGEGYSAGAVLWRRGSHRMSPTAAQACVGLGTGLDEQFGVRPELSLR